MRRSTEALVRLDDLTRRLRRECPWDREQDERSIVPHTVEEAYELADAANAGDDAKLLDELGDVLFQVHFLSLLMEERGAGDLAQVADHCHDKLVRRHPHVFSPEEMAAAGLREAQTSGDVLRNWDAIKSGEPGREPGIFGEVPENLPAPLLARKVQRRAASTGFDLPDAEAPLEALRAGVDELAVGRPRRRGAGAPVRRGRGRAVRRRQRRAQAPRRPGARPARRDRPLPRPRRGGRAPRRPRAASAGRSSTSTPSSPTTPMHS